MQRQHSTYCARGTQAAGYAGKTDTGQIQILAGSGTFKAFFSCVTACPDEWRRALGRPALWVHKNAACLLRSDELNDQASLNDDSNFKSKYKRTHCSDLDFSGFYFFNGIKDNTCF